MKRASLILSIVLIAMMAIPIEERLLFAIKSPADVLDIRRLTYPLLHANWLHIAVNLYTLLSLVFLSNAKMWQFIVSFMVAMSIPSCIISDTPMLGLSVVNFALTGVVIANSDKWLKFFAINLAVSLFALVLPGIAAIAHLYGLSIGLLIGFSTTKRFNE